MRDDDRTALLAHYRALRGLYCRDQMPLIGATLFADPTMTDPEWSHIGLIDVTREELPRLLTEARKQLGFRDRPVVLAIDPWTRPASLRRDLRQRGWRLEFRHRWSFYRGPVAPVGAVCDILQIEPVANLAQMESFIEIFHAVFTPPGEACTPGSTEALRHSLEDPLPDLEVVHHLGTVEGQPVAIGTSISLDNCTVFYNLGVLPGWRGRGFGAGLSGHRVHQALARGSELLFLQTEAQGVARWQGSQGWEEGFVVEGWGEP